MNELLNLVVQFNAAHQHKNIFAFFEFAGHTQGVWVQVQRTSDLRFAEGAEIEHLYSQSCYLDGDYGQCKDVEELTSHFKQWVNEFELEVAA